MAPPPPLMGSQAATQTEVQLERARAQTQQRPLALVPTISLEETLTDNVNLKPAATRRGDLVTQIIPGLQITENGARTKLNGTITVPILLYARTGSENNRAVPQINLLGKVEAIDRLLFVDGAVYVTQEYFTPFGSRSASLVNNPDNAYIAQNYRVSPYLKGVTPGGLSYELRDNNIWSNLSSTPISVNNSYTNEIVANLTRQPLPLGWALDYNRSDVKFKGQEPQITELGRSRVLYRADPAIELSASLGYEHNRYPFAEYNDFIYGAGARWRPTERTNVDATWEHRFFGSSYRLVFDHRTPLSIWTIDASRNVTSYPQVLAQIPAGGIVPLLLDFLFTSRIPDPVQRQQFVLAFMQDRGLPLVLTSPFNLYTQQIYLEERASATAGLIGVRNTLFVTGYRARVQPIIASGSSLPPIIELLNNNTQVGAGLVWTYNLTAVSTLAASVDYVHTTANPPLSGKTDQGSLRIVVTTPMSANTSVYAGARFQSLHSDFSDSSRELAGYAGITHTFR